MRRMRDGSSKGSLMALAGTSASEAVTHAHGAEPADEGQVLAKIRRRLIPFMFLLYIVSYLDRVNVGFAALQMNQDLGLSASVFGLGSGIFFIGYFLFEVPSNLIMERVGARLWIARIMISWGLVSAGMMFMKGAASFYTLRFLLGLAEAGFFPGMILYLTYWFPAARPCPGDRALHDGERGRRCRGRPDFRRVADDARLGWSGRVAVAVSARGLAGGGARRGHAALPARRPARRRLARAIGSGSG